MEPDTLIALQDSIRKWERILVGEEYDDGTDNCPLCARFYNRYGGPICNGCPVEQHAGRPGCQGTPYDEWYDAISDGDLRARNEWWHCGEGGYPQFKSLAQAEIDFLKGLLPK